MRSITHLGLAAILASSIVSYAQTTTQTPTSSPPPPPGSSSRFPVHLQLHRRSRRPRRRKSARKPTRCHRLAKLWIRTSRQEVKTT